MVTTASGVLPFRIGPLNNIQPFTYRDGTSHVELLEKLRVYINDVLRVQYNEELDSIVTDVNTLLDAQDTDFTGRFDTFVTQINALVASINNKTGPVSIQRATLTGPYTITIDPLWPTDHVVEFRLTQDAVGGRTVSNGAGVAGFLTVNTAPNGVTDFDLVPVGDGTWNIRQTTQQISDAIAGKLDTAVAAATYAVKADTDAAAASLETDPLGNKLYKLGIVLDKGAPGSFDNVSVESLTTFMDPESGRLAGVYTGYGDTGGIMRAGIGLAYSDDGITWTKNGQLLGGTGMVGDADKGGTTGPSIVLHNGIYHLFYIGLSETGYEGGSRSVMLATSPSLRNPVWTRRGKILDKGGNGWRMYDVWHPQVFQNGGKWYCFVNASGLVAGVNQERIGYATAPDITGPWTFDDLNSPLLSGDGIIGDPCVNKVPGGWRMDYYYAAGGTASDWYTTTTDTAFPLGWRQHDPAQTQYRTIQPGVPTSIDEQYAHKPFIQRYAGKVFHYYTAVNSFGDRRIAAAVDTGGVPLPVRGGLRDTATPMNIGTFSMVKSGTSDSDALPGPNWGLGMLSACRVSAKPGDMLELTLGYVANDETGDCRADAVILVNGVAINYLSKNEHGFTRWGAMGGRFTSAGGTAHYELTDADISHDTVEVAPVFRVQSGTRRVFGTTADPIEFTVRNLG